MSTTSQQIVQTLWRYCNILRDDGLSYPDYVEQLTYLLFLKMAHEQHQPKARGNLIPRKYNWESLVSKRDKVALHRHYTEILSKLAAGSGMLRLIFSGAENKIRDPAKLSLLVNDLIDKTKWSDLSADVKGDAYEGLLEKNAQDTKSGAGQYFTPRSVIEAVVEVIQPQYGERICDPACGSCGFLLAAIQHLRANQNLSTRQRKQVQLYTVYGNELVPAVARLGAMNLFLHGIGPVADEATPPITVGDSLESDPGERYDVVITNPPFGRKSSVTVLSEISADRALDLTIKREDFWASTSNKQLNFVQHVVTVLARPGRAAIVVPDNVLFEEGAGETVRRQLLEQCNVHTLLRLPAGIFYAGGVKANVLFLEKTKSLTRPGTQRIWVYDLRTGFRVTLRTNPLQRSDLDEFVDCYRASDFGGRCETWSEENATGRWRSFTYQEVSSRRNCNLDIAWQVPGTQQMAKLLSPGEIASEMAESLRLALEGLESISEEMKR